MSITNTVNTAASVAYLKDHGAYIKKVTILMLTYNPNYSTYNLTYCVP